MENATGRTGSEINQNIKNMGSGIAQEAKTQAKDAATYVKDQASRAYDQVERIGSDVMDTLSDTSDRSIKGVESYIKENPLTSILISGAVGLLVGRLVCRSNQ